MSLKFPKLMQHRTDPYSQVVVANQEQYDALPEEFKPEPEVPAVEAPKRGRLAKEE